MSVNEERMFILKMLEEGKITSDEASKLLEALDKDDKKDDDEYSSPRNQKQANFQDEVQKMRSKIHDWKRDIKKNYNQKDFDRMVDDFASKAEKLGKNLAVTTVGIVDKVVDFVGSFVDTNVFNAFASYATVEKSFEIVAIEGMELDIEGINGYISVKKHLDNKVVIKSKVKSPQNSADGILMMNDDGNKVSLKINNTGNISVSHEIFLPAVKFEKVRFETSNSRIYVEDTLAKEFEAVTKNSYIELMGINSDKITANTKNARIQLSYVIGRNIEINTKNSLIDIKHLKAENITACTANGRIFVENAQNYENSQQLNMNLMTSNGGIKVNMNDMENRGYKIKAKTTNGGINLLIPELLYHNVNKQGIGGSFVEAENSGYEGYGQRVYMNAETQNGFIEVVK